MTVVRRSFIALLLVASLASVPVCSAGAAFCNDTPAAQCCCGDEASCPCAHSQGETPAPQPATAPAPSGPQTLAVAAVLTAAASVGPLFPAGAICQDLPRTSAEGPDAFLANCAYRC